MLLNLVPSGTDNLVFQLVLNLDLSVIRKSTGFNGQNSILEAKVNLLNKYPHRVPGYGTGTSTLHVQLYMY